MQLLHWHVSLFESKLNRDSSLIIVHKEPAKESGWGAPRGLTVFSLVVTLDQWETCFFPSHPEILQ